MATNISMEDVQKMKVQDLKKELKARDLPTSGNKSDLVARLQESISSENGTTADDTEDVLLEGPENGDATDLLDTENAAEVPKDKDPEVVSEQSSNKSADETGSQEKPLSAEERKLARAERFGVVSDETAKNKRAMRFGIVSDEEKKKLRAAKFGIADESPALSKTESDEKKAKRAERFGITTDVKASSEKGEMSEEERQRLLKRKARFGEVTSNAVSQVETDEKLKQRAARFGAIASSVISSEDEDKKKKRMERFAV